MRSIAVCIFACVSISCEKQRQGGTDIRQKTNVAVAVSNLRHAGSLSDIRYPTAANVLGISEDGLTVFLAFECEVEDATTFINQEMFRDYYDETSALPVMDTRTNWWTPENGKILKRIGGSLPDKRALEMSINQVAVPPKSSRQLVTIYLVRYSV